MMRFDAFTEETKEIAVIAANCCAEYQGFELDIEHLLLAIFKEPPKTLRVGFAALNVNIEYALEELASIVSRVSVGCPKSEKLVISNRVKRVIDQAYAQAKSEKSELISPVQVFIAVVCSYEEGFYRVSPVRSLLRKIGITPEAVKQTFTSGVNSHSNRDGT